MDPPCRESFHDLGMVAMISWMIMDGNPWAMDEKFETGRSDAKTDFKKDGYGPIFDHYPLLELKQNEVRSIMSDIQFN